MGRPKEFDPDVALGEVMERFWESGYDATSLADITAVTGVKKASLYVTYGDKRQLFITALARYQDEGLAQLTSALSAHASVRESFRAVFTTAACESASKNHSRGCFCVNTAIELAPRDEEIAKMLHQHARRVEALFAATIARGQSSGEFTIELDKRATARSLLVALYGAHVAAKMGLMRAHSNRFIEMTLRSTLPMRTA